MKNKENPHSQSSQLEEEDLQKFENDSMPVNTKKPCVHVVAPWLVAKCMQVLRLQAKCTRAKMSLSRAQNILCL